MKSTFRFFILLSLAVGPVSAEQVPPFVKSGENGKLSYRTDEAGNRVPDFSSAGYGGGGVPLPMAEVKVVVPPVEGDDGARIQAAIDHVSSLELDSNGLRGAVLLEPGRYEVDGQVRISVDGVVLRGSGSGSDGSTLVATGTGRRALIQVWGESERKTSTPHEVADDLVPVGAVSLELRNASGLEVGDSVVVSRPATEEWIQELGWDTSPARQQFSWKARAMTLTWDRTITAIQGKTITFDTPITTALDRNYGGGTVSQTQWTGRISRVGIENLRCESAYDDSNPLDEQHAWQAVSLDHVRDAWMANLTAVHFAGSAFKVGSQASRITVQDCISLAPVSELGGYRRHTFTTSGQQTLFLRCRAEDGRHDFTTGYKVGGPTVFLECEALRSHGFSGSVGSWSSGMLFDNVTLDGGTLELSNRETWNQGVAWAAANSMLWQCSAPVIICRRPPTAQNWADGVWGQFVGNGWWSRSNEFIRPQSLYRAQLEERLGEKAVAALAARSYPSVDGPNLEAVVKDLAARLEAEPTGPGKPLALEDGVLTVGGKPLAGREARASWWRGYLLEGREDQSPMITRYAPGKFGPSFTADLAELAEQMAAANQTVMRHHYGLWYDRRRMDHERMRRPDADVWPPFYEQPFARSGKGSAWDGLSRYDLKKYNSWYFSRLKEFASHAREKGLVLINEMYFQHNILEAGAHWVDSPWRGVNNINGTQFTEPPPFTGDTVKMAAEFYDLSDPDYRTLHRAYIRKCLSNLADEPNVIHTLSAENSGPLNFMQFWIDVVGEWEKETGKDVLIALSAFKDVQDAILADPEREPVVDVIDLTYWYRDDGGREYAPAGGTDRAPRQHNRSWMRGGSSRSISAMAKEYREKYPDKAVISGLDNASSVQPYVK